jgi:hypothetical protein
MTYVWRKPKHDFERQVPDHLEFIATDPPGMTYGFKFRPMWHVKSNRWIPIEGDKAVPLGLVQHAPGDKASSTLQQKPLPPAKVSPPVTKVAVAVAAPPKPEVPPDRIVPEGAPSYPAPHAQCVEVAPGLVAVLPDEDVPKKQSEVIKHKIAELKQAIDLDEKVLAAKRRLLIEYQAEAFQAIERESNGKA